MGYIISFHFCHQGVYSEYERTSYEQLISQIEAEPSKAVQEVLKSFLAKIYKRQK